MQPAALPRTTAGAERLLFTRGPRLGWVFRDRRQLIAPYAELQPDPQLISGHLAARRQRAGRAWRLSLRWVARPLLPLALVLYAASELERHASPHAGPGTLAWLPVVLAAAGVAWPAYCLARLALARRADPGRAQQAALDGWRQRAAAHEQAELARLDGMPEWASATCPARRTDVYGGTLDGWQSLLAVNGASILAERPLLVADLTGHLASEQLTALARRHGVPAAVHLLPAALTASGMLTGLTPSQLATALAEAIHAGAPAGQGRAERAVDARVIMRICAALGGSVTLGRLATAVQAALGQPDPGGDLTAPEWDLISSDLLGDAYRAQVTPSLVRLDAFLSSLARYAGTGTPGPARPAWYTCLAMQPGGRGAATELLAALTIQWLTTRVTQSSATTPAVIIAGADESTRDHLEALAGACERRDVPLTLLFRHLREDATALIGGAAATAFMRLGNHHEAEQAAAFIGRHHTFTVSGWTATSGTEHSTSHTSGYSHGTSQSAGTTDSTGWNGSPWEQTASGGHTQSRDHGRSQEWSQSDAESDGTSWSTTHSTQRVYEYAVEPSVLQNLPSNALLLPARRPGGPGLRAVECNPRIITLPGAIASMATDGDPRSARPAASPGDQPQIAPPAHKPAGLSWRDSPGGAVPARPVRPRPPHWPAQPG